MLKQQNFFDRNIPAWKQVLFLSWPTIVELLLQTAVNYVDTAMVGSIGVNATAAVSITMSTIWLINGFMNAVGIGYSVLAAHSIGEGNYEQAKVIIRQSILAIGVAGIFLTLMSPFSLRRIFLPGCMRKRKLCRLLEVTCVLSAWDICLIFPSSSVQTCCAVPGIPRHR